MCMSTLSHINCGMWLDASQRSWDCIWLNRSAREVKCKSALSSPKDWILRYIKTYLFTLHRVPAENTNIFHDNHCLLPPAAIEKWINNDCIFLWMGLVYWSVRHKSWSSDYHGRFENSYRQHYKCWCPATDQFCECHRNDFAWSRTNPQ